MKDTLLLCVPGQRRYRRMVVRAIATACKLARRGEPMPARLGTDEDHDAALDLSHPFDAEMVTAVSEAFNAIVARPDRGGVTSGVILEIHIEDRSLAILIRDYGKSLEQHEPGESCIGSLTEGDIGLFMIRSFVDHFVYRPGSPNLWLLEKDLPRKETIAGIVAAELEA